MKVTERPKNDQKCADEGCGHPFGEHYITHGGAAGCSGVFEAQRDGTLPCDCKAFTIKYTYPNRDGAA